MALMVYDFHSNCAMHVPMHEHIFEESDLNDIVRIRFGGSLHVLITPKLYIHLKYFIDTGLNYELQFGSNDNLAYVLSPGPVDPISELSVCLWLKTSVTSTFVYYHVEAEAGPAFQFGINPSNKLFGIINGSLSERYT